MKLISLIEFAGFFPDYYKKYLNKLANIKNIYVIYVT